MKMSRKNRKNLTFTKEKNISCDVCGTIFTSLSHFKRHLMSTPHCKSLFLFSCKFCKYVGYNENRILHHLSKNQRCYYLSEQDDVSTGLLPDTSSSCNLKNDNLKSVFSYRFKRYSADGIVDNVQLDLQDDTTDKRGTTLNMNSTNTIHKDLNSYMTNSQDIAGVHENIFPSNFQLGENYNKTDNTFSLSNDNALIIDDSTISSCNNEDELIISDDGNGMNDTENIGNDNTTFMVPNDNITHNDINITDSIDLRSKQEQLAKRVYGISLSK